MIDVKHHYSFKPFGDQRHQRSNSNIYDTTFRSTLQTDSPHFRGQLSPYNVKHALVDPSHTHVHPPYHPTRKEMNFTAYDWKQGKDNTSRNLQHIKRETYDFNGKMILRLPEERDYFGEGPDPISSYYSTKKSNEGFFQKSSD